MIDRAYAFDIIRKSTLFGRKFTPEQVAGIDGIITAFEESGVIDKRVLAYALATAYHETGKHMSPIKETVMPYHKNKNPTDQEVVDRLNKWARKTGRRSNIYWKLQPNGKSYFGRGQVQLTWIDNYRNSSKDAGYDLVAEPERMLDPVVSAKVLISGLMDGRWNGRGKGVLHYLETNDLKNARRTVNVIDQWEKIAAYYAVFLTALK